MLAIVAGALYGVQFVPLSVWNKKIDDAGDIFGHRVREGRQRDCGALLLLPGPGHLPRVLRRLRGLLLAARAALVPPGAMLPCVASGLVWSLGCMGGILATAGLGNSVGFVLVLNLSLLVNSAWSVFYFRKSRASEICACSTSDA